MEFLTSGPEKLIDFWQKTQTNRNITKPPTLSYGGNNDKTTPHNNTPFPMPVYLCQRWSRIDIGRERETHPFPKRWRCYRSNLYTLSTEWDARALWCGGRNWRMLVGLKCSVARWRGFTPHLGSESPHRLGGFCSFNGKGDWGECFWGKVLVCTPATLLKWKIEHWLCILCRWSFRYDSANIFLIFLSLHPTLRFIRHLHQNAAL